MLVAPGEKIPLDGIVVAGHSDVNQAPITGESLPVDKRPGDEVFAGTINGHGALTVRVTRAVRDTTLARIVHLVEAAQAERAPAQQFIDRFARWYTPAVVHGRAAVFRRAGARARRSRPTWVYRALVLLVVACPCALVISTPVSIVAALADAAQHGVLVKGGAHLERLAGVRVVAFDKTGTLTCGEPAVVTVEHVGPAATPPRPRRAGCGRGRGIALRASDRRAIVEAAHASGASRRSGAVGARVSALPGLGAEGTWRGDRVVVGNARLVARARAGRLRGGSGSPTSAGRAWRTAVFVAIDGRVRLALGVADRPRPVAADVVRLLRGQGIAHVAMLTGDTRRRRRRRWPRPPASTTCAPACCRQTRSRAVATLRAAYGPVAMVGDGVNDAPGAGGRRRRHRDGRHRHRPRRSKPPTSR